MILLNLRLVFFGGVRCFVLTTISKKSQRRIEQGGEKLDD